MGEAELNMWNNETRQVEAEKETIDRRPQPSCRPDHAHPHHPLLLLGSPGQRDRRWESHDSVWLSAEVAVINLLQDGH